MIRYYILHRILDNNPWTASYEPAVEYLQETLGLEVRQERIKFDPSGPVTAIVFGAHLFECDYSGDIIFNSEQLSAEHSPYVNKWYKQLLSDAMHIDYSAQNLDQLYLKKIRSLGFVDWEINSFQHRSLFKAVQFGFFTCNAWQKKYGSALTIPSYREIDVLFYGSLNPRRANILQQLAARGLKVTFLDNAWGQKLIEYQKKSKIILNVHFYPKAPFEVFRCMPAVHSGALIVSESGCDNDEYLYEDFINFNFYDELADRCKFLIDNPEKLNELASSNLNALQSISIDELQKLQKSEMMKFFNGDL